MATDAIKAGVEDTARNQLVIHEKQNEFILQQELMHSEELAFFKLLSVESSTVRQHLEVIN